MKKELDNDKLNKKINKIKSTRKRLLVNPSSRSIKGIRKLQKTIRRLPKEWLLDNHSKRILLGINEILALDILYLEDILETFQESSRPLYMNV